MIDGRFLEKIYRKEVLEPDDQSHIGPVILATPISYWVVTSLIALITILLFLYLFFGEYTRKEMAKGVVVPRKGIIKVSPKIEGTITKINVKLGENVQVGAPLLEIKNTKAKSDGKVVSSELLENLRLEKVRLEEQLIVLESSYALKKTGLQDQKQSAVLELRRMEMQIKLQAEVVNIEDVQYQAFQRLKADDAVSSIEIANQRKSLVIAKQNLNNQINEKIIIADRVKQLDYEISMLPFEFKREENELRLRLTDLSRELINTESQNAVTMFSPINGKVSHISSRVGQTVELNKTTMSILPVDGKLQGEVYIPTRAAGVIQEGQIVNLHYDAFPYQKFGYFQGTISSISRSVVSRDDLTFETQVDETVFIAVVELDEQTVTTGQATFPLQVGMTLRANIILERRKNWEWILSPLLNKS